MEGDPGSTQATDSSVGSVIQPVNLRSVLASLHTDTTFVEVSDLDRSTPTVLTFTPHRIVFSSLVASTATIQYGYVEEGFARTASVGNILFMLPGREVNAQITPGRMCTVTCSFENGYAEARLGSLDAITHAKLHDALDLRSALTSSILLRLMQEALHPGAISHEVVDSLGHAMLIECAHWLRAQESGSSGKFTAREFQRVEEYLAGLTGKAPSVTDLAALCGLSERYFAKLFREYAGMTASQYIKAVQLSKAKGLLLETDFPLKEIAYRLGYSNIANFTASFRSATGFTPGQYRTSH